MIIIDGATHTENEILNEMFCTDVLFRSKGHSPGVTGCANDITSWLYSNVAVLLF